MHESITFGRVLGIRIGANWSVLIIAVLLAVGLATGALPEAAEGYPTWLYWGAAVVAALVFFSSLLAHELAHAVVARRAGMPVEGITLWALGGVSKFGDDAPDSMTELRVAIAGPGTSVVLGIVFFALTGLTNVLGGPDLLAATLGWLAVINLLLGFFNLMPAFPLDGGRVLRAVVWGLTDDRLRATRTAAAIGRGFGYVLVAIGFVVALNGWLVNGLWFALLGWFVLTIAQVELNRVEERTLLGGVRVVDVMTPNPVSAPADITVADFVDQYLMAQRHSSYPLIGRDGRLAGYLTLDAIRRLPEHERPTTSTLVAGFPVDDVPVAAPTEPLLDALPRLTGSRIGRIVVVDEGRVVGLVSGTDVASYLHRRSLVNPLGRP